MSDFVKRASRRFRRSSTNAGRALTCGAKFVGLLQETQQVLVQSANQLPKDPLPDFLIVLCQGDDERFRQCHQLEKDKDTCDLMYEGNLFLIPRDAAAAIDAHSNHKHLRFHKGIDEKILYRRSEDPKSNLYVPVEDYDKIMIRESAEIIKKALQLAGARTMRSRVAHVKSSKVATAIKVDGMFLGTGPGATMSSSDTELTKDAALWSLDLLHAHHPFEMLPEDQRYFLHKLDDFHESGHLISLLENTVKEGQPICERLEIKVTHARTLESVRKLAIKVAKRFDPISSRRQLEAMLIIQSQWHPRSSMSEN